MMCLGLRNLQGKLHQSGFCSVDIGQLFSLGPRVKANDNHFKSCIKADFGMFPILTMLCLGLRKLRL